MISYISRMLQKVKLTDKDQIEKERKEKGFALYVNGANDPKAKKNMRRKNPSPSPRSTNNARLAAGKISPLIGIPSKIFSGPGCDIVTVKIFL